MTLVWLFSIFSINVHNRISFMQPFKKKWQFNSITERDNFSKIGKGIKVKIDGFSMKIAASD